MKNRLIDIYNDGYNLISDNTLLIADSRFSDLMEYKNDLDIIIEDNYESRELFPKLLNNEDYNLNKIYRSVYAVFLANMVKYSSMLDAIKELEAFDVSAEYGEVRTFGERTKITSHGAQTETKTYGNVNKSLVHGAKSETKTYGDLTTNSTTGASTDSTTNGQRANTSSVVPSFGTSNAFVNKEKSTGDSSIDSTTYGARSDTEIQSHGQDVTAHATYTDTDSTIRGNDSISRNAYSDNETQPETIDTIEGYKNKLSSIKERFNAVSRIDLLNLIANDVANQISFNYYL